MSKTRLILVSLLALFLLCPAVAGAAYYVDVTITATPLYVGVPLINCGLATNITGVSAVLPGNITHVGGNNATVRGFEWGYSAGNYTLSWNETGNFTAGEFQHAIYGLTPEVAVYWRALAENVYGVGYSSECVFVTGSGLPLAPTDFTITRTGVNSINVTWTMGVGATLTTIRVDESGYPITSADGYPAYNGNESYVEISGLNLDQTTYSYGAWSWNAYGYSADCARADIGGSAIALIVLGIIALGLTIAMFVTRASLLGFPAGMFWAILSGFSYQQSATTWDWQYILFFGSIGMAIFSFLAAYTLRKRDLAGPDMDEGKFIDEKSSPVDGSGEEENL